MILPQERVFFDCAALLDAILEPYGEQDPPLSEIVRRGFDEATMRQVTH